MSGIIYPESVTLLTGKWLRTKGSGTIIHKVQSVHGCLAWKEKGENMMVEGYSH